MTRIRRPDVTTDQRRRRARRGVTPTTLPIPPVWFDRIGLTGEQVDRYGCGTRPCKASERPHFKNHVAQCSEVDWLRANEIAEIVRTGIQSHTDAAAMRATLAQERRDKAALHRFAQRWAEEGTP